jgi:phosphoserine aminotransferase
MNLAHHPREDPMSRRAINFNPGPAALPLAALERARDEFTDFAGTGMAVAEVSHRSREYEAVHNEAIALVRELLAVPPAFRVLLLQGGASLQFAMLPLNLLGQGATADYVLSGHWAERAHREARAAAGERARIVASTKDEGYRRLPRQAEIRPDRDAAYLHFCSNNTIEGTQWQAFPESAGAPLACDMSSDFLSRRFDLAPFGIIYAGAQKNAGPAGLAIVIVREDVLERCDGSLPAILQYRVHADRNSLYNTPPTLAVYLLRNVLDDLRARGGVAAAEARNREKANLLYGCVDRHAGYYRGYVLDPADRSLMNATFTLPSPDLEDRFVKDAEASGMAGLRGHRDLGGLRVSMYNAVTADDVLTLVSFMDEFARRNG